VRSVLRVGGGGTETRQDQDADCRLITAPIIRRRHDDVPPSVTRWKSLVNVGAARNLLCIVLAICDYSPRCCALQRARVGSCS